jgi:hypothetical protein
VVRISDSAGAEARFLAQRIGGMPEGDALTRSKCFRGSCQGSALAVPIEPQHFTASAAGFSWT